VCACARVRRWMCVPARRGVGCSGQQSLVDGTVGSRSAVSGQRSAARQTRSHQASIISHHQAHAVMDHAGRGGVAVHCDGSRTIGRAELLGGLAGGVDGRLADGSGCRCSADRCLRVLLVEWWSGEVLLLFLSSQTKNGASRKREVTRVAGPDEGCWVWRCSLSDLGVSRQPW
jgi:hypothetical protein